MSARMSITDAAHRLRAEFPDYMPVISQTVTVECCHLAHLYDIDLIQDGRTVYTSGIHDNLETCIKDLRNAVELDQWDSYLEAA